MNQKPNINNAAYLKASESYCLVVLPSGKYNMESRPMKYFEQTLLSNGWCKIHKSYLVNPNFVKHISEDKEGVYLENGTLLPISRRKRKEVMAWRWS